MRFVAIFAVLLFHIRGEVTTRGLTHVFLPPGAHWLDQSLQNGDRGVGLFFVISGFILARPFLRQHRLGGHPVLLGNYFKRRLTRLEPPYVLSLLIYTAAAMIAFHIASSRLWPHLLASMFYLHNPIYARESDINFVTWSLEVEVQFYLLAPFLCKFYKIPHTVWRRSLFALLTVAWGAMVWRWRALDQLGARFGLLLHLQYFFAGLLLADLLELPRYANRETWSWDAVSVLGWMAIFSLPRSGAVEGFLPMLIVPVCLAAFRGKASNWIFRQPFIALTGGMCYSIYLMHMLLISISFRAIKHVHLANDGATFVTQSVLLFLVIMLVAPLYFVFVERPCMDPNWPDKIMGYARRFTGVRPAPAVWR